MNDDELPEVGGITAIFPFVMVLSAVFATGLLFTVVNVPLLLSLLSGTPDSSLVQVATAGAEFWRRSLPDSPGVGVVLFYLLALFTIGFAVQPIAIVYVTLIGMGAETLLSARWKAVRFYSPLASFGNEYLTFADWIHRHRLERTHWEWELFHHYLYAGIAFNVLSGASLSWLLSGRGRWNALALGTTVVLSTGYSLARSAVLQQVHNFYSKRAGEELAQPPKTAGAKPLAGGGDA